MPGIDFDQVKRLISMDDVLNELHWRPLSRTGAEERGRCPIHGSTNPRSRSFAVNRTANLFCCFSCGAGGNHLDLFMSAAKLDIHAAAAELCRRLGIDVPYHKQRRGARTGPAHEQVRRGPNEPPAREGWRLPMNDPEGDCIWIV
jgi:DNA primase